MSTADWRCLPPNFPTSSMGLASQTQVLGDMESGEFRVLITFSSLRIQQADRVNVTKFDRFWDQGSQLVWTAEV